MIKFVEITNSNIADVISLSVHDNQKEFVADNAISLAEAYATRNEGNVALPYAMKNAIKHLLLYKEENRCYIKVIKGKPEAAYLLMIIVFQQVVTICGSGDYFFSLKTLRQRPIRLTTNVPNRNKSEYVIIGMPSFLMKWRAF